MFTQDENVFLLEDAWVFDFHLTDQENTIRFVVEKPGFDLPTAKRAADLFGASVGRLPKFTRTQLKTVQFQKQNEDHSLRWAAGNGVILTYANELSAPAI